MRAIGRVSGKITYGEIEIERGGRISGEISHECEAVLSRLKQRKGRIVGAARQAAARRLYGKLTAYHPDVIQRSTAQLNSVGSLPRGIAAMALLPGWNSLDAVGSIGHSLHVAAMVVLALLIVAEGMAL